jgi:hypothetical protein
MLRIYNGTSHEINFFREEDCKFDEKTRKLYVETGCKPYVVIPPGTNLNAVPVNGEVPLELQQEDSIPLKGAVRFEQADELPEGYELYIVSNMFRSAYVELGLDTNKLATVGGTVYDASMSPRPCGCTCLNVG